MNRNQKQGFSRHKNDKKELTNSLVSSSSRFRELYVLLIEFKIPKSIQHNICSVSPSTPSAF